MIKCVNIDNGLRVTTDGKFTPCCIASGAYFKDDNGNDMNVLTTTFDQAINSPTLKKLKEGFKELYGDTIYAYLLDHKMEEARRMLNSQKYNVNEVGLKLGYSTASHFISAFKKQYGTTPKKYIQSLN